MEKYTREDTFECPVSFNGKVRFKLTLEKNLSQADVEKALMAAPDIDRCLGGKPVRKIIVVPNRIINVVC